MAIAITTLTDDLRLRLSAGKPSQDFEITEAQLDHWVRAARDSVVTDYIERVTRKGDPIPMEYLITTASLAIGDADPLFTVADFAPTAPPLDVEGDKAIARIDLITTSGTIWTEIRLVNYMEHYITEGMEFSKADLRTQASNEFSGLTAWRRGTILYINGMETGEHSGLTVTVYYVGEMAGNAVTFSIIGSHVLPALELAEKLGRRELGFPQLDDNINDGK